MDLATTVDPDLEDLADAADLLTPFAVTYRYPGLHDDPGQEDTRTALDAAETVLDRIQDRVGR